jgi:drug/metabolite transporter (DMT)-like permease
MTQASPAARPQGGFGAPFAALVAGALAMGLSPIFVRLADVGPFASAFWRVALALPLLWAWLKIAEAREPSDGRIGRADIFAGLAFAGDLFFWHLSIVTTSVANATFFATCAPI